MGLKKLWLNLVEYGDTWVVDTDKLLEFSPKADLIVIVDPNNPTGSKVLGGERSVVEALASKAKGFIIIDETYYEFSGYTVARYINEYPNIIVVRSLSKAFCLAGFRLGYVIADKEVLKNITKVLTPFDIPTPSLAAGIAALENVNYYLKIVEEVKQLREYLYTSLRNMGFKVYRSFTNFLLVKDNRRLDLHLLRYGIAIKRVGEDLYRISIGTKEICDKVVEALRELR